MTKIKKPNLLIAGFQKCASTSLYDFLIKHDKIVGSEPKESYYLCDQPEKFVGNSLIEKKWSNFFGGRIDDTNKYLLEATVANFYQEKALNYALSNKCKVIFIVRDPLERLMSIYKYQKNKSILKESGDIDFSNFINNVKTGAYKHELLSNAIEHGKYHKYIEKWRLKVGFENVFVLGLKDLIGIEKIKLVPLFDFLDIKMNIGNQMKVANKSRQPINLKTHLFLVEHFGGKKIPLKNHILKLYKYFSYKQATKPELGFSLNLELRKQYSEEYKHLSNHF